MARLRYCRCGRGRSIGAVLVHESGATLRDAEGHPLVFPTKQAAADFARAFLCEPHQVV